MERAVMLLPEPLSPTRQSVSPGSIESETPSRARTARDSSPNSSCKSFISSKAMRRPTGVHSRVRHILDYFALNNPRAPSGFHRIQRASESDETADRWGQKDEVLSNLRMIDLVILQ